MDTDDAPSIALLSIAQRDDGYYYRIIDGEWIGPFDTDDEASQAGYKVINRKWQSDPRRVTPAGNVRQKRERRETKPL